MVADINSDAAEAVAGELGQLAQAVDVASGEGVAMIVKMILAPFGARCNAINSVAGETLLLKGFMCEDRPEARAKFISTIPLERFSTPEDMGNTACYLSSDKLSMVTIVCMEVDGGR